MDIIELMNKQNALECEIAEMKRKFPLEDKNACLRYAAAKKEVDSLEAQICAFAEAVDNDPSVDYSGVTGTFAAAINAAAENGTPVEDVIFGVDSILDLKTVSCMFKIVRSEGKCLVIGGELSAQCKAIPWLLIRVSLECDGGEPVWSVGGWHSRPYIQKSVGCGYHLDGSYQRGVLAFFRREYARQQALLAGGAH